jgi:hypothetical protein
MGLGALAALVAVALLGVHTNNGGPQQPAVFQGGTVDISQHPWMASLQVNGQHNCGAVLVTEALLLTAAHCVTDYRPAQLSVILGVDKPNWNTAQAVAVVRTQVDPAYGHGATLAHDLAIIQVAHPVTTPPATLLRDSEPAEGSDVEIIGWGCTLDPQLGKPACAQSAAQPASLQAGWMKVVNDHLCDHFLVGYSDSTHLCLNSADTAANAGDSGGPALVRRDRSWLVAGIASNASFDEAVLYNGYTSLLAEQNWIDAVLNPPPATSPATSPPSAAPATTAPTTPVTVAPSAPTPTAPAATPSLPTQSQPQRPAEPPDRAGITSYDQMRPGASYWGRANYGWQQFTAASNTLTFAAVTWGTQATDIDGATTEIQICQGISNPTLSSVHCDGLLADARAAAANYGSSGVDFGDLAVTIGQTYFIVYYQPPVAVGSWDLFWWNGQGPAGRSDVTASDQMQAVVKGFNRT